jgi:hypothetical protein
MIQGIADGINLAVQKNSFAVLAKTSLQRVRAKLIDAKTHNVISMNQGTGNFCSANRSNILCHDPKRVEHTLITSAEVVDLLYHVLIIA